MTSSPRWATTLTVGEQQKHLLNVHCEANEHSKGDDEK
jgi:hypothetical protein